MINNKKIRNKVDPDNNNRIKKDRSKIKNRLEDLY